MANSGPNSAGAVAEFDDGWGAFSNVANAITSDGAFATAANSPEGGGQVNYLDYTSFGTFTGVANGDSVSSITFEVKCKVSTAGGTPRMLSVQLLVGGVPVGDPLDTGASSVAPAAKWVSSGSVSLASLGTTLSGAQANAAGFGFRVSFTSAANGATFSIDDARVTLTGTFTGGGGGGGSTGAAAVRYYNNPARFQ